MTEADELETPAIDGTGIAAFCRPLWPYLRPYRMTLLVVGVVLLIEAAFNASLALAFKYLIDHALLEKNARVLTLLILVLAIAGLIVWIAGIAGDLLFARVIAGVVSEIRERMFAQLQQMTATFFGQAESGNLLSRFSGDLGAVETAIANALPWGVMPLFDVVTNTVLLFVLNPLLAAGAMLVWPLVLLGPRVLTPRAIALGVTKRNEEGAALTVVQEQIAMQAVVRAFALEVPTRHWFARRNAALRHSTTRMNFASALVERSSSIATHLLDIGVLGFGGWLTITGRMSIGTLVAFEALFLSLSHSLGYLTQFVPSIVQGAAGMQRIAGLLDYTSEVVDKHDAKILDAVHSSIEFRNVSFAYNAASADSASAHDQYQLRDVNLVIHRGEHVAIVGPSGSGKSTLLGLLLRFHDPVTGDIEIDGLDIRNVTQRSVRARFGTVFQEPLLFNLSIRENIRLGNANATDSDVEAAAESAELDLFIRALPDGYETFVGERGVRLSGGQRQRITIARALVRSPEVLLLDEPTSSLDRATEAAIMQTIKHVSVGKTMIMATHRLSAVVETHRIAMMEDGRLIAIGTHEELLATCASYQSMWVGQVADGSGG